MAEDKKTPNIVNSGTGKVKSEQKSDPKQITKSKGGKSDGKRG